ncbi:hypothetical protein WJX84_010999 [Apatococcus fuscideae]|uniref:Uncharacterized protein n=1 Tax=Apatococcus fuscideae TaxID=2026836 RepID=A0AAW1RK51_9CHLO
MQSLTGTYKRKGDTSQGPLQRPQLRTETRARSGHGLVYRVERTCAIGGDAGVAGSLHDRFHASGHPQGP